MLVTCSEEGRSVTLVAFFKLGEVGRLFGDRGRPGGLGVGFWSVALATN
jgi:hypothetical protein